MDYTNINGKPIDRNKKASEHIKKMKEENKKKPIIKNKIDTK